MMAMAEINTRKCALRDDDARAAMHRQWILTQQYHPQILEPSLSVTLPLVLLQLEAAQVHCTLAMAEINTHECALRDDDARAAMHQQWIAMQLAGEPLDEETQLYADMIWAYSDIQKEQAVFKAEPAVKYILLLILLNASAVNSYAAGRADS